MTRIHIESEHGAIAKFLMARSLDAPADERERLRDLAMLHSRVAGLSERVGGVLLQLSGYSGKPGFSHFVESIQ